jgi:membrane fusion protein, multidrug efflux system
MPLVEQSRRHRTRRGCRTKRTETIGDMSVPTSRKHRKYPKLVFCLAPATGLPDGNLGSSYCASTARPASGAPMSNPSPECVLYDHYEQQLKAQDRNAMNHRPILVSVLALISFSLPACHKDDEELHEEHHKLVVTNPVVEDVVVTQPYVCQIHSQRHIEIRALEEGYLEAITVKEGQAVKEGEIMFRVLPPLYKAKWDAELAEAEYARVEYDNTEKLYEKSVVSNQELALYRARLAKAVARAKLAEAELKFTEVKAPFDGIMDRLEKQQGSLVKREDLLTTLSDNSLMWVYFNVPEARYLEYKARQGSSSQGISQLKLLDSKIELVLANGKSFPHAAGNTVTVEGNFNNRTGNIPFRADFPNPDRLLRHGQTGTVRIHHTVHNAVVIPQRATFEFLDKQYVWVVGEDDVAHQRLISIAHGLEDEFVVKSGLDVKDKIIVEGVRQIRDGDKIEYEFRKPAEILSHQKNPAE